MVSSERRSGVLFTAGLILWLAQIGYVAAELITVSQIRAPYSLLDNTVSDAGARTCTTVSYPWGPVPVCSPLNRLLNGATITLGMAMAVGAMALHLTLPSRVRFWGWVSGLAVVTGMSLAGTGLVPLDANLALHTAIAMPQFLTFPALLIVLAASIRRVSRRASVIALAAGMVCVVGAVGFASRIGDPSWGGLLQRLALWPPYLALPLVAISLRPRRETTERPISKDGK